MGVKIGVAQLLNMYLFFLFFLSACASISFRRHDLSNVNLITFMIKNSFCWTYPFKCHPFDVYKVDLHRSYFIYISNVGKCQYYLYQFISLQSHFL